tara:strand:- start:3681 stop:4127 length:447 start_codon:yes stop_codon:yes gene_type:complete
MSKKLQKVEEILDEQMNPIKEREELEEKFMEFPELEEEEILSTEDYIDRIEENAYKRKEKELLGNLYDKGFENGRKAERKEKEEKEIHKRLHEINTFQCVENELYLRGKDEFGKDFTLCMDAFNFLDWIDAGQIEYIKKQVIKYIKSK